MTGFPLGFGMPWLLLVALPVVGLLVSAYRRRGTGRRMQVPTLFLLREFKATVSRPRRFVPPLRFFLELLFLSLLVLWSAGLFQKGAQRRVAVVLDNSMSMRARQTAGKSVFEEAKRDALVFIDGFDAADLVELYETTPKLESVTNGLRAPADAIARLDGIQPANGADNLESLLLRVLERPEYEKVIVFTDRTIGEWDAALGAGAERAGRLTVRQSGSERGRLGNASVGELALDDASGSRKIRIPISNYSPLRRTFKVTLESVRDLVGSPTLGAESEGQVTVEPNQQETIDLELASRDARAVMATIVDTAGLGAPESLTEDNRSFLSLEASGRKALIVSPLPADILGASKIRGFSFDARSFEELAGMTPEDIRSNYELAVVHRGTPGIITGVPVIYIAPNGTAGDLKIPRPVDRAAITSWEPNHPLMSYLSIAGVELRNATVLDGASWGEPLMRIADGPVVLAGERQGGRTVTVGFELLPFEGKRSLFSSVLLLNALKWARGGKEIGGGMPLYSPAPGIQSVRRVDSDESTGFERTDSGQFEITEPGIYLVTDIAGVRSLRTAQFIDPTESNTLSPPALRLSELPEVKVDDGQPRRLDRMLLWAVVAMLFVDLVAFGGLFSVRSRVARQS